MVDRNDDLVCGFELREIKSAKDLETEHFGYYLDQYGADIDDLKGTFIVSGHPRAKDVCVIPEKKENIYFTFDAGEKLWMEDAYSVSGPDPKDDNKTKRIIPYDEFDKHM